MELEWYLAGLVLFGILACLHQDRILNLWAWLQRKYQSLRFLFSLAQGFQGTSSFEPKKSTPSFVVCDNETSAIISYQRLGKTYNLLIPYSSKSVAQMAELRAYMNYEDGKSVEITQQPGVPYLISAKILGVSSITLHNLGNDKSRIYTGKELPFFGSEIL